MAYFSDNNRLDWAQDKINERYSKAEDMEPRDKRRFIEILKENNINFDPLQMGGGADYIDDSFDSVWECVKKLLIESSARQQG